MTDKASPQQAYAVRVVACQCGSLHVRLHDHEGHCFAEAVMKGDVACGLAEEIANTALAAAERQALSVMRCEGSA